VKSPAVRPVPQGEEELAISTIVLAFADDPVARWTWPHSRDYLDGMPKLVRAFGGNSFAHGAALCIGEYDGAALWMPPDVHPDEEKLGEALQSTVEPSRHEEVFSTFEQMAKFHPEEPHWYLPLIGVDPAHQGKGLGAALLSQVLERCDHERTQAYLESTNPRNSSLYLRHGFVALGEVQAGASPKLILMLRSPRKRLTHRSPRRPGFRSASRAAPNARW